MPWLFRETLDGRRVLKIDMVGGPVKPPAGFFLRIYGSRIFDELLLSEVPEQSGSEREAATLGKTDIRGSKSRMSKNSSWMTSLCRRASSNNTGSLNF